MPATPPDPRTEAEKARADLKRNDEMGLAIAESDAERLPSTTPETFGEHPGDTREDLATDREGRDDPLPTMP